MVSSPLQTETNPNSPLTAPREIPDSNPSSPASPPPKTLTPSPPLSSTNESSIPNTTLPSTSPPPQISSIPIPMKTSSQETQKPDITPPPPPSTPQQTQETHSYPPPPPSPLPPLEAKKITHLKAKIHALETQLQETEQQQAATALKLQYVSTHLTLYSAQTKYPTIPYTFRIIAIHLLTHARRKENAKETVRAHIKLLHDYNEIRDVGLGLLGMIAEQRGVRVVDVFEEFGVQEGD